jgi:hypothetical protein
VSVAADADSKIDEESFASMPLDDEVRGCGSGGSEFHLPQAVQRLYTYSVTTTALRCHANPMLPTV